VVKQTSSGHHVPALDGVRGLAILSVLLAHFVPALADAFGTSWARLIASYAGLGGCGVDLFFVLSGFLITGILLDTRESPDYWRSFFGRRALRILPLYYIFLIALYLTNPPRGEAWKFWFHLSNWRSDLGMSSNILTWHFWSLAIEEQFYFVWPIVVAVLPVRALGPVCLLTAVGSLTLRGMAASTGAEFETLHRLTPLTLDGLSTGSYLAWAVRYRPATGHRLARLALPAILGSALAFWALGRMNPSLGTTMVAGRIIVSLGGGALVLLAAYGPAPAIRILSSRPLCVLGRYCYGLYLLHPIILVKEMGPVRRMAHHVPAHFSPLVWVLALTAGLSGSLALAAVSWRLLEAPCLSLKRRFPYRPASTAALSQPHIRLTQSARQDHDAVAGVPERRERMKRPTIESRTPRGDAVPLPQLLA
jgi:peptidoglycan/LPS O-acetylase OafA/YrhL